MGALWLCCQTFATLNLGCSKSVINTPTALIEQEWIRFIIFGLACLLLSVLQPRKLFEQIAGADQSPKMGHETTIGRLHSRVTPFSPNHTDGYMDVFYVLFHIL